MYIPKLLNSSYNVYISFIINDYKLLFALATILLRKDQNLSDLNVSLVATTLYILLEENVNINVVLNLF